MNEDVEASSGDDQKKQLKDHYMYLIWTEKRVI